MDTKAWREDETADALFLEQAGMERYSILKRRDAGGAPRKIRVKNPVKTAVACRISGRPPEARGE